MLQSMIVTSQSHGKDHSQESQIDQLETKTVPQLLCELVDIVTKIAKADQMMAEVEAQTPQDPAAEKWREISKQAFAFSRDAMKTRQQDILEMLKSRNAAPTVPVTTNAMLDAVETKDSDPSTPSTTDRTPCQSEVSAPTTPPGLSPLSAPKTPPGLDC